jgi:hypothetical protein
METREQWKARMMEHYRNKMREGYEQLDQRKEQRKEDKYNEIQADLTATLNKIEHGDLLSDLIFDEINKNPGIDKYETLECTLKVLKEAKETIYYRETRWELDEYYEIYNMYGKIKSFRDLYL